MFVRNQELQVNDDNEPTTENVLLPNQKSNGSDLKKGQVLGCYCIDKCAITGAVNIHPKFQDGWQLKNKLFFGSF